MHVHTETVPHIGSEQNRVVMLVPASWSLAPALNLYGKSQNQGLGLLDDTSLRSCVAPTGRKVKNLNVLRRPT